MFLTPGTLPFESLWEKFLQVWCWYTYHLSFQMTTEFISICM
jgi:hypothetical protein